MFWGAPQLGPAGKTGRGPYLPTVKSALSGSTKGVLRGRGAHGPRGQVCLPVLSLCERHCPLPAWGARAVTGGRPGPGWGPP